MAEDPATKVLEHYVRRYVERVGKLPRRRDLDPTLARTLIRFAGDTATAIRAVDTWFTSPDPWYGREGFAFDRWWVVFNRLAGTGHIQARGTPEQQEAARKFAAILVERHLRVVR